MPVGWRSRVSTWWFDGRLRIIARSPWTCLGGLATVLLILCILTAGFPATRQLFAIQTQPNASHLLFIWRHPALGGVDRGLPSDVPLAWAEHSKLLRGVSAFNLTKEILSAPGVTGKTALVVRADRNLFAVLGARPALGAFPTKAALVVDHRAWISLFHSDREVIGRTVPVGGQSLPIAAVLPSGFQFFTREPSVYWIEPVLTDATVMIVAQPRAGAAVAQINRELTKIAEDFCYYHYRSQLRLRFFTATLFSPLTAFGVAIFAACLMGIALSKARLRHVREAWRPDRRAATAKRVAFFLAKTTLALVVLFIVGLEFSRPSSALILGSRDPASGPYLLWFYIAGAMGILFISMADQRARCRECLQLLGFPVRIGCPGRLWLDWSGTELLCSEGHGVLHVSDLATSWQEEEHRWISIDESWRELFAETK